MRQLPGVRLLRQQLRAKRALRTMLLQRQPAPGAGLLGMLCCMYIALMRLPCAC